MVSSTTVDVVQSAVSFARHGESASLASGALLDGEPRAWSGNQTIGNTQARMFDETTALRRSIVQVSNDEHLARSRSLLLHSLGFRVKTYSISQVDRMLLLEMPFALFLCQTLAIEKAVTLGQSIRSVDPSVYLVRATHSPASDSAFFFDRVLPAPVMPRKLTREMLGLRLNNRLNGELH